MALDTTQPIITYNVSKLGTAGGVTPVDANAAIDMLDSRIEQANTALNDLSLRVERLNTKSAIIRQHVPIATGVVAGNFVYYDAANARFDKAQALTLAETTETGNTIEAPQARVEGLIIGVDAGGGDALTGTMLCGGYWEDSTLVNTCLEDESTPRPPGIYYLSPVTAGKATRNTYGHLRQPVLSYYGAGKMNLSIFYMAHDNHYHSSQRLDDNWIDAAEVVGSTVNGVVITGPSNAQFVYSGPFDYGIGAIGDTTAVFRNGVLQDTKVGATNRVFVIQDNLLWYCDSNKPAPKEVTIFNHYPFAYDTSVVRTVVSASDAITVTNTNGLITIKGNDFENGAISKSSYAISAINGKTLAYTPVITDIAAGPGIVVSKALDGSAYISSASNIGGLIDAYNINHNGTTLISNGLYQYITFPASRRSSFIMMIPVTGITTPCTASVWGMKYGEIGITLGIQAQFIPDPTTTTQSAIPNEVYTGDLQFASGEGGNSLVYSEVQLSGCTVSGNGTLIASVSVDLSESNVQVQLLRAGFKFGAITANIPITEDEMPSITQFLTAGEHIEAGTAVMIYNDAGTSRLVACTNVNGSYNNTANKCVGVAMHDAEYRDTLQYLITGTMTYTPETDLPLTPGQSLYIGTDGKLVPVANTTTFLTQANYLQKVGTLLETNKIQVNIEPAVRGN